MPLTCKASSDAALEIIDVLKACFIFYKFYNLTITLYNRVLLYLESQYVLSFLHQSPHRLTIRRTPPIHKTGLCGPP